MHEVVVRNRLEQLRKRQRDEAIMAQQELLSGSSKEPPARTWGGDMRAVAVQEADDSKVGVVGAPEAYHRSMSPAPIDIKRLSYEDRQLPVVSEKEDKDNLVSDVSSVV